MCHVHSFTQPVVYHKAVDKWMLGGAEAPPNFWHLYLKDIAHSQSTQLLIMCSESYSTPKLENVSMALYHSMPISHQQFWKVACQVQTYSENFRDTPCTQMDHSGTRRESLAIIIIYDTCCVYCHIYSEMFEASRWCG